MRFWDTSALVPLLLAEEASVVCQRLYREDPLCVVWWGTEVECVSAVARLEREGALSAAQASATLRRLDDLAGRWLEVQPVAMVRTTARRLLRVHPLRAADALQLAAALVASEGDPASLPFVSGDARLRDAATREGFVLA